MAGGIDLTIEMEDTLADRLGRAIAAAQDLTPAMGLISDAMMEATRDRFDNEVDPLGVPWKRSQRAIEDGGKTLTASGRLRGSITPEFGRDYARVGVLANAAAPGDTPVRDYARIHQEGGTIRPRTKRALSFAGRVVASVTLPRRAYIGIGNQERDEIPAILVEHLDQAFRGSPGGGA